MLTTSLSIYSVLPLICDIHKKCGKETRKIVKIDMAHALHA